METEPTVDIVDGGDVNGVADNESPNNIEQTENSKCGGNILSHHRCVHIQAANMN